MREEWLHRSPVLRMGRSSRRKASLTQTVDPVNEPGVRLIEAASASARRSQ